MVLDNFALKAFKLVDLSNFDVLTVAGEIGIDATSLVSQLAGNFIGIALAMS
jgi:hypothetical protein